MRGLSTASRTRSRALAGVLLTTLVALAGGADPGPGPDPAAAAGPDLGAAAGLARRAGARLETLYRRTPPHERVTWGGLAACALLGLGVTLERSAKVRRRRVLPPAFAERFRERLAEGTLDRAKGLDFCELNPSPAARVALAALKRWGRPTADLERAVALAKGIEVDRLRRNVGTLRRVAALAPLIGLLGTLTSAGRALSALGPGQGGGAWGPVLAGALAPLTAGVALAIVALVAFDGLAGRIEALAGLLDRLGAETVDAIAMAAPPEPRPLNPPQGPARTPHQLRIQTSTPHVRPRDRDDDRDFARYRDRDRERERNRDRGYDDDRDRDREDY